MLIEDDGIGISAGTPNPAASAAPSWRWWCVKLRGIIVWSDGGPGTRVEITVPLDAVSRQEAATDGSSGTGWTPK